MNAIFSDAILGDRVLAERVRRANRILEEVIGSSADSVSAEWNLVRDSDNRPLVLLVLTDFTGVSVEARFMVDELVHQTHLVARFYTIWGDLLQARSHWQLKQLSG